MDRRELADALRRYATHDTIPPAMRDGLRKAIVPVDLLREAARALSSEGERQRYFAEREPRRCARCVGEIGRVRVEGRKGGVYCSERCADESDYERGVPAAELDAPAPADSAGERVVHGVGYIAEKRQVEPLVLYDDEPAPATEGERTISAQLRRMLPAVRQLRASDLGFPPHRLANAISNAAAGLEAAERALETARAEALEEAAKTAQWLEFDSHVERTKTAIEERYVTRISIAQAIRRLADTPHKSATPAPAERERIAALAEHWSARLSGDAITMYNGTTHWEGCEREHWRCAMARLTAAILATLHPEER